MDKQSGLVAQVVPNTYDTELLLQQFRRAFPNQFDTTNEYFGLISEYGCLGFTNELERYPLDGAHGIIAVSNTGRLAETLIDDSDVFHIPPDEPNFPTCDLVRTYWLPIPDQPVQYRIPAALADQTTRLIHPGQSLKEPQGHQEETIMQFEMPVLLTGATRYNIDGKVFVSLQVLNSDPTNKSLKGLQPAKMPAEEVVFDRLPEEESAYPYQCSLIVLNKVSGGKVTQRCIGIMSNEKNATAPNNPQPAKKAS